MVEHAYQAILGAHVGGGHLHRLGDGDAKAAQASRVSLGITTRTIHLASVAS
jgi:hypothetical protein